MSQRESRYGLMVFDFDGTLVDSEACIRRSLTRALEERGVRTAIRKDWIGLPLETIVRSACGEVDAAVVDEVVARYREHYATLDPELTTPFPGIIDAVQALVGAGVRLAIATNKHSSPARATLDRFGLTSLFDPIAGGESVERAKPHPDLMHRVLDVTGAAPSETLMIGDAIVDLQMAAAAGVDSCAVTWGNHTRDALMSCRPTHIADRTSDLLQIASRSR